MMKLKALSALVVGLLACVPDKTYSAAVIFSGSDVKALKPNLDLNGSVKILSGSADPSAVAVSAPKGSLYLNNSNGSIYRKTDNGSSTNWTTLVGSSSMTSLTGDVTGTGPGATATTVAAIQGTTVSGTTGTGNVVFSNSPTLVTPALGTPSALVGTNITGTASGLTAGTVTTNANLSGPITSVGNVTSVSSQTGTGSTFVMQTSPTLITPDLGTPSAGILTNATGLPISTGVSGLGTGIASFLGTPSSANLATALTDETGSGALVFATSPSFTTPDLGTPSAATLTNATGLPISTGVSGLGTGVATFLATPSSANLASALTDETGSGAAVFANSPQLVTPDLGTPSTLVGTNITGTASGLTAGVSTTGSTVASSTNASFYPLFVASSSDSNQAFNLGTGLTFNPSTNTLSTTTFSGALTGTASGNVANTLLTTKGDLHGFSTVNARIPVGSNGQRLIADSNQTLGLRYQSQDFKNYILNKDAEVGTEGWSRYSDAADVDPVDGTGGTPNTDWTRTTSSPLRDTASFLWTKNSGANRQGEGVSYDFTIDQADLAKPLSVSFEYIIASGTFTAADGITAPVVHGQNPGAGDSTIEVYVYDLTNSVLVPVSPKVLTSSSTTIPAQFKGTFQTSANSTSYRLILHTTSKLDAAMTAKFDNFYLGPQSVSYGAAVTDWQSYTITPTATTTNPTKGATAVDSAQWRRVGDSMEILYNYRATSAGTAGSGTYLFNIPSGYSIDTTKITADAAAYGALGSCGTGYTTDNNAEDIALIAQVYDSTRIQLHQGGNAVWGSTSNVVFSDTSMKLSFSVRVPISGWSSTVQMSNDTDTRVVAMAATGQPATAAQNAPYIYPTVLFDLTSSYSPVTGKFTVPVSGIYEVSAAISASTTNALWGVYVNNVYTINLSRTDATYGMASGTALVKVSAGDTIHVGTSSASGTGATAGATEHSLSIRRLSGPPAIAATESVYANYNGAATGTINGSDNIVTFPTKISDSHNAYSSGTYTVPGPGAYSVSCQVGIEGTYSTNVQAAASIYVNGAIKYSQYSRAGGSVTLMSPLVAVNGLRLIAGDAVTCRAQTAATSPAFSGTPSAGYFSIARTGN